MDMIQINLLPKEFRKKTGKLSVGKSGYYAIGATVGVIALRMEADRSHWR